MIFSSMATYRRSHSTWVMSARPWPVQNQAAVPSQAPESRTDGGEGDAGAADISDMEVDSGLADGSLILQRQ